jgi:hypothetical protein
MLKPVLDLETYGGQRNGLTWPLENSQCRLMEFQDIFIYNYQNAFHPRTGLEQGMILFEKRNILGKLLICVQKCIKRIGPSTCNLLGTSASTRIIQVISTWRQNFMGPQTKHKVEEVLRKTSITFPYWSIASRNLFIRVRFISSFRRPCSALSEEELAKGHCPRRIGTLSGVYLYGFDRY